jgi:type IV pilus assembly protein PilC
VREGGDPGRTSTVRATRPPRWAPSADDLSLVAALLDAGLTLLDALATLESMAVDPKTRAASIHLQERVSSGGSLAAALEELSTPMHVRMLIDGGERTGGLVTAFRSAAVLTLRLEALRSEVRRALVYPGLVLAIGLAILTVIALVVVPPLERTFADLGGEIPRATRIVLVASGPLSSPTTWAVVAMVAAIAFGLRGRAAPARIGVPAGLLAEAGRSISAIADHLPVAGPIRRSLRLTVLAQVMASLLGGGTTLDAAMRHAAGTIGAERAQKVLREASVATAQGRSPFVLEELGRLLDPAELAMLRVGERTGLLAEQWGRVAQRRDRVLEDHIRRSNAVLEPVLVALVGAVVGGAVLALYLPTFRVMELL